jgi:glycosyltransferase involved in cell wall biosynthesis
MNMLPPERFTPADHELSRVVPLFDSAGAQHARIALVGTYTPRKCGIATFTTDVVEQLRNFHPDVAADIYTIDDPHSGLVYDTDCRLIAQDDPNSYTRAARAINESGVDAIWVQHEFGIFGGTDGEMVCDFVDRVAAPLIVTFHTVLSAPSAHQRAIMRHLISRASRIMVMSEYGRNLLLELYEAPAHIVEVIPHGAPDRPFGREGAFKQRQNLGEQNVLMTFGLLGPGKGLENVIKAMPAIIARHPNTLYRIVGATHPNLMAKEGESYREKLQALAARLGIEDHIAWENRFLDTPDLLDQLEACDIYVTPYGNLQQSTSGTLSYAVALGKAVVSTPYVHARELLADDIGVLIEPHSAEAVADAIIALLDDPAQLSAIKQRAYTKGRTTIWPEFARSAAALVRSAIGPQPRAVPVTALPGLSGVFAMSDGTGMLQHAIGIVPDRRHGYCLDDNVRALMLMNVAEGLTESERQERSLTYASFIQHAWNPEAKRFRNFMHFDRDWAEDIGSEDSNGRALWTLGQTVEHASTTGLREWAMRWFDQVAVHLAELTAPRSRAFTMLGAAAVLRVCGSHRVAERILDEGGAVLHRLVESSRRPDWSWFEAVLGYDNPRLSQALIEAGVAQGRSEWTEAGLDTLSWIADRQTAVGGYFRAVGSETFGSPYSQQPFDQQPLEAQAAIEAAEAAYAAAPEDRWVEHALTAYRWYFGANDRRVVLADVMTGRCRDGVTPRGANENCGAESILAFQLGYYSLTRLCKARSSNSAPGAPIERQPQKFGQSASNL